MKMSTPPSDLAQLPSINVYFLNAHTSFTDSEVNAVKVNISMKSSSFGL
jgi:hypothetical protein